MALNLADGFGSEAGNSRLRFESARFAIRAQAGIRVAIPWGYVSHENTTEAAAIDRLGARLHGLRRR